MQYETYVTFRRVQVPQLIYIWRSDVTESMVTLRSPFCGYNRIRDDNWSHFLTRDPRDPWPATHDYSRVMTPDYCSFQSGPLSGSALEIKHHHCHKILRRNNWIKLTLWLSLCCKSVQCPEKNEITDQRVTSTDPWPTWPTQICWPTWPVTRWPIVTSEQDIMRWVKWRRFIVSFE